METPTQIGLLLQRSTYNISFLEDYINLKKINRSILAEKLGYTTAGFNALFNNCDNIKVSVLYRIFDIMGAKFSIDIRRPEDPPTVHLQGYFSDEERPLAALLIAMKKYNVSKSDLATKLGVTYRLIIYMFTKNDINFYRLLECASLMGLSVFINIEDITPINTVTPNNDSNSMIVTNISFQKATPIKKESRKRPGRKPS